MPNKPTNPKKSGMLTLDSSPIFFFMVVAYTPYITALIRARTSPTAICVEDLCGNVPRLASLLPDISTLDVRMMPAKDARTPKSFLKVNRSTPTKVAKIRVQMPTCVSMETHKQNIGYNTAC